MPEIFVRYLAIVLAVGLVLYCIGCVVFLFLRFQPKHIFTSVFLKIFVGCFSFTAICALYFTSLKTIFSGLIICIVYFFTELRLSKRKGIRGPVNIKAEAGVLLLFLVVVSGFYTYRYNSITHDGDSVLNIPNSDFTFYARISHFLVESGIESATPSLIYQELNARDPYHYFDIWFNGGVSFFSSGDNLQILFLVSYTIGISLVWLGFCSIAENLDKLTWINVVVAFLATFFLPLQSFFSESINQVVNQFFILIHAPPHYLAYGLWNLTKIYPIYLVFISAILAFLKHEKGLGLAILSVLPFIYTTVAIPIMLTLSVYVVVDYFFGSRDKAFFFRTAAALACVYLFILAFYYPYLTDSVGSQLDPFRRLGVEPIYKSIFRPAKIFLDASVQLLVLVMPFLVLLLIDLSNRTTLDRLRQTVFDEIRKNNYVQFGIVLYASSLVSWCILFDIVDANQFFVKTAIVMVNILCFIIAISLRKILTRAIMLLLCGYFVVITNDDIFEQRLYSQGYMEEIERVVDTTGRIGGFMLGEADYKQGYGNNIVEVLGDYITLFRPDIHFVNLSLPDSLLEEGIFNADVERRLGENDFYKFMLAQKKDNVFSSVVQSRRAFINEFDIECVIVSPHVILDSLLEEQVLKKITDTYSGQAFLLLNKGDE